MMRLAQRDVRAVRGMVDDAVAFSDEIFGFHAQQAVEKSAKAWLGGVGIEYPKTHDLDLLFELLQENGATIPAEYEDLRDLVDFSVQYRYEAFDELPLDRTDDVEQSLYSALRRRFVKFEQWGKGVARVYERGD